jgi:hypothetical protein
LIALTIPSGRPSASSRPRLDMQFDERRHAVGARRAEMIGVAAERLQRVAHRDAAGVLLRQGFRLVDPGEAARAGQSVGEAHALLVAESDDLERDVEPSPLRREALGEAERGERAERAVVAAGVAHGVDMRADHQRRGARPPAFVARADVADRIDARRNAALFRPGDELLGGAPVRLRQAEPRQSGRVVGEGGERVEPRHQPPRLAFRR